MVTTRPTKALGSTIRLGMIMRSRSMKAITIITAMNHQDKEGPTSRRTAYTRGETRRGQRHHQP